MKLLVATTNPNKVREIRAVLDAPAFEIVTLADLPPIPEPVETGNTFWENAREKALAYAHTSRLTAVAEDSGIEIRALGGEPGVRSARFLGPDVPYSVRFAEIYRRLSMVPQAKRDARFVTALAVAEPDGRVLFETEATIDGEIADSPVGTYGFGYDPIFFYRPLGRTTAELTTDEKSAVSHRARAVRNFAMWCTRGL
jgi:XTP/dITP diphosphohydrolase